MAPPTALMSLDSFSGLSSTMVGFTMKSAPHLPDLGGGLLVEILPLAPASCSPITSCVAVVRSTMVRVGRSQGGDDQILDVIERIGFLFGLAVDRTQDASPLVRVLLGLRSLLL